MMHFMLTNTKHSLTSFFTLVSLAFGMKPWVLWTMGTWSLSTDKSSDNRLQNAKDGSKLSEFHIQTSDCAQRKSSPCHRTSIAGGRTGDSFARNLGSVTPALGHPNPVREAWTTE